MVSTLGPRRPTSSLATHSPLEVARLWDSLAESDERGTAYLAGRSLWPAPNGAARFNVGRSGDWWLDGKAALGYRVAVAMRDAAGALRSIALRYCGAGEPPNGLKVLNLAGAPASGVLFALPEFWSGAEDADPVFVCEGLTDFLAGVILTDELAAERETGSPWPFGVPGVGAVDTTIRAFATAFRGRRIYLALDADDAGREATTRAAAAAKAIGSRAFRYVLPAGVKDLAESLPRMDGAA
jgi:hypothetical protein